MLPTHYQYYQEMKQALAQLQINAAQSDLEGTELMANFLQVQQSFQQQVNLSPDLLSPAVESRLRYQTEIHKQLRLLGTDLTFLRAARQANTINQRRAQVGDRLQTLINYCDALLQVNRDK